MLIRSIDKNFIKRCKNKVEADLLNQFSFIVMITIYHESLRFKQWNFSVNASKNILFVEKSFSDAVNTVYTKLIFLIFCIFVMISDFLRVENFIWIYLKTQRSSDKNKDGRKRHTFRYCDSIIGNGRSAGCKRSSFLNHHEISKQNVSSGLSQDLWTMDSIQSLINANFCLFFIYSKNSAVEEPGQELQELNWHQIMIWRSEHDVQHLPFYLDPSTSTYLIHNFFSHGTRRLGY